MNNAPQASQYSAILCRSSAPELSTTHTLGDPSSGMNQQCCQESPTARNPQNVPFTSVRPILICSPHCGHFTVIPIPQFGGIALVHESLGFRFKRIRELFGKPTVVFD